MAQHTSSLHRALFSRFLQLFLLIGIIALPSLAFAVDSDGDGVDDSVDAFPNHKEASVDTDGDGKPNTIVTANIPIFENFESNSFSGHPWVMGGNADWIIRPGGIYPGSYAARSGVISYPQVSSSLQITQNTGSTVSFRYVAPTYPASRLNFYVDGQRVASMAGNPHPCCWSTHSSNVTPGLHVLKWEYVQAELDPVSSDGAWIDEIVLGSSLTEDTDDDNDGVVDNSDRFPLNAAASSDSDNDGYPGSWLAACDTACQANSGLMLDNCPSTSNADQMNTDDDAQGNVCDSDDDNDGVVDTSDAFPLNAAESLDTDSDGIGNNADFDDDNDGLPDGMDPLPLQVKFNRNANYKGSQLRDSSRVQ